MSDAESQIGESPRGSSPPATQMSGVSKVKYAWVILFNMDVDDEAPFIIVRLTHFKNSDFPWAGITEEMTKEFRVGVRKISNMPPENSYCIFGKIEHGKKKITYWSCPTGFLIFNFFCLGTSHERRKKILTRLNSEYHAMVSVNVTIVGIYHYFVESENYRVLSQYEYSWNELPLRSGRISQRPAMTDVSKIVRNVFPIFL